MPLEIKLRSAHDLLSSEAAPGSAGLDGARLKHGLVQPDPPVLTDILLTLRQRPEEMGWKDLSCLPGRRQVDKKRDGAAGEMVKETSVQVRRESREQDEQRRR